MVWYIFHEPLTDDQLCDNCFQQMKFSLQHVETYARANKRRSLFLAWLEMVYRVGPQRRAINLATLKSEM